MGSISGFGGNSGKDTSNLSGDFRGGAGGGGVNGPGENGTWSRRCNKNQGMATRTVYGGSGGFCAQRSNPEDCVIICECGLFSNESNGYGGFGVGGGGAGNIWGSGGGGGYSGGSGGISLTGLNIEAGGGGSYIDPSGYYPSIIPGISCGALRGDGMVILEYRANNGPLVVPTIGEWGLILLILSVLIVGNLAIEKNKRPMQNLA